METAAFDWGELLEVVLGALGFALVVHVRAWVKLNPDTLAARVLDSVVGNYGTTKNAPARPVTKGKT